MHLIKCKTERYEAIKKWWLEITGPRLLLNSIVESIQQDNHVFVSILEDPPFFEEFRYLLESRIEENGLRNFQRINISDKGEEEKIEDFLIRKINGRNLSELDKLLSDFSERIAMDTCKNNVYWVEGVSIQNIEEVYAVIKKTVKSKPPHAVFIFVGKGLVKDMRISKEAKINFISMKEMISEIDTLSYSYHLLGFHAAKLERKYLPYLLMHLCDLWGHIAFELFNSIEVNKDDPIEVLKKRYQKNNEEDYDIEHPFSYFKKDQEYLLAKKINKAQIQAFFPFLESERQLFIEKYQSDLSQMIPRLNNDNLKDVYDYEFKDLIVIGSILKSEGSPLFTKNEYSRLHFLKKVRNDLAHSNAIEPNRLVELVEK
jgi:hypothetical protein